MKLRSRLKSNDGLYSRFQVIESKARQLLEYSQAGAPTFTPHGLSHVSAVEANYDWLLSDADVNSFNDLEIFTLLCATLFHDALMFPRRSGDERKARDEHVQRAVEFLRQRSLEIGLQLNEAHAISETIRGHAVANINQLDASLALGPALLELRKLGACLSMADICHADESRAPLIVLRHLSMDEDSEFHWRRHLQIAGITRDGDSLLMSALIFTEDGEKAVTEYKEGIEKQIKAVEPYFAQTLSPIRRVTLQCKHLSSPLEQTFKFQANMPAILDLLIEGVYQRSDVMIRELVQNSLDACLIRKAKMMRRNERYEPEVLLTVLKSKSALKAIRIDDNGVGMDVADIRDTMLWIGSTIAKRDSIKELLDATVQKNLIATFGIGLLSCFKVAQRITVRTKKESSTALEFIMTDISSKIEPHESTDQSIGTTIITEIIPAAKQEIKVDAAIAYYFRDINQVSLRVLESGFTEKALSWARNDVLRMAITESARISPAARDPKSIRCPVEIRAEKFHGQLWIRNESVSSILESKGSLDILNEGIFVASVEAEDWLPEALVMCGGVINFAAKAVDLPASRDAVKENSKLDLVKTSIAEKGEAVISALVTLTGASKEEREWAALLLSNTYSVAAVTDESFARRMLRAMDSYQVTTFQGTDRMSLRTLREDTPKAVHLYCSRGKYVANLEQLDGRKLYHEGDDEAKLQATILAQRGEWVLDTARDDLGSSEDESLFEKQLLEEYFSHHHIQTVDLNETNVIEGTLRSKPVPRSVRDAIGSNIKFVEVPGLPNRRVWNVGGAVWVNLENESMRAVYELLQRDNISSLQSTVARVFIDLLAFKFEEALEGIQQILEETTEMGES